MVAPSFPNNILWYGVAVSEDTAWIGQYSHLDREDNIQKVYIQLRFFDPEKSPFGSSVTGRDFIHFLNRIAGM